MRICASEEWESGSLPCCSLRGCARTPSISLLLSLQHFCCFPIVYVLVVDGGVGVGVVAVLLMWLSLSRLLWTDPAPRAISKPRAPRREGEADASQEHIKIFGKR
ncbi:unnamed protein product, partial [Ectocarpus sp. 12 AP-2014]